MYFIKKFTAKSSTGILLTDGMEQILEFETAELAEKIAEVLRIENPKTTYEVVPVGYTKS